MRQAVYDKATGRILFQHASRTPFAPTDPTMGIVDIPDGVLIGVGTHDVQNGVVVPRAPTLADNQRQKRKDAERAFVKIIGAGFTFSGVLFQIDDSSRSKIAAKASLATATLIPNSGVTWDSGFTWLAANNTAVPMTAAQMIGFAQAAETYYSGCILRRRAIKDQIAAVSDQAMLDAIDVTAGYPNASAG